METYITANFVRNMFGKYIAGNICRYVLFSILKCLPLNRTGFRPQTFTFELISGPCRPFQCLASKFLNFYKFSSSYLIVQAFGPSGRSNVDDRVVFLVACILGLHQLLLVQQFTNHSFGGFLSCLQFLVQVFLLTINRDYYY